MAGATGVGWEQRHPALRDALLWSIPALLAGAALRLLILSYLPFATVRPDSDSYLSFAYRFLLDGDLALYAKRRYMYPIALLPACALPGAPLHWIAWLQHAAGLLSVLPLAYAVRCLFGLWKVWIVPCTLFWSVFPMAAWYEHEVIADAPFAILLLFALGGWIRWLRCNRTPGAWWGFFIPFALCVLTKPAGKFLWLAPAVAFLLLRGWWGFRWPHWVALAVVAFLSAIQGDRYMAARHLCMSAFPYLQLDTARHAELKAEIRPKVERARARFDVYYMEDDDPFAFLGKGGRRAEGYPAWQALIRDERRAARVMRELGREAILARPDLFVTVAVQRALGAANPSAFEEKMFRPEYTLEEMRDSFGYAHRDPAKAARVIPFLFGERPGTAPPDLDRLAHRMVPRPDAPQAHRLERFARRFHDAAALLRGERIRDREPQPIRNLLPPTLLGWGVIAGAAAAVAVARFRQTAGVWVATAACYLVGVFAVASSYPRFFYPVWPILLLALCAALETGWRVAVRLAGTVRTASRPR